ncbi:hypothetical protein K469DRAFT_696031 [Zopfia rhizophila CBS 207.26]|uniref:Uncharacterized protein n=1 Tax=Zopfia rhizophila CBS 207.26 TaxID=1314779 RepID=A0A6A6EIQ0_9PEZI|nr:hypothetical protein K469DRAFT_696031 [Zopfia rhizophila CBS 207.26]
MPLGFWCTPNNEGILIPDEDDFITGSKNSGQGKSYGYGSGPSRSYELKNLEKQQKHHRVRAGLGLTTLGMAMDNSSEERMVKAEVDPNFKSSDSKITKGSVGTGGSSEGISNGITMTNTYEISKSTR